MSRVLSTSIDDWVQEQIIGKPKNKSARVQELIIKGYIAEQKEKALKRERLLPSDIELGSKLIPDNSIHVYDQTSKSLLGVLECQPGTN
jgi:hypothetical protein